MVESNGEKDGHFPQIQPALSFTEPIDHRRNTDTAAVPADATTEIVPSKAEQICTITENLSKLADLTTVIPGVEEDQDDSAVFHQNFEIGML